MWRRTLATLVSSDGVLYISSYMLYASDGFVLLGLARETSDSLTVDWYLFAYSIFTYSHFAYFRAKCGVLPTHEKMNIQLYYSFGLYIVSCDGPHTMKDYSKFIPLFL